jgi:hypothetical protein
MMSGATIQPRTTRWACVNHRACKREAVHRELGAAGVQGCR